MLTLGHVATALCITLIFICAETCQLEIFSIKPNNLSSQFDLSFWSGPQTLPPSDWSKVWGAMIFWNTSPSTLFIWPCYLSPILGLAAHVWFYYSTGHSCFCMPSVLAIIADDFGFQHPIDTTCQLGLSLPAYIVRGTFILSALQYFGHPFMVMALTTLGMDSTIFLDWTSLFFVFFQCLVQFVLYSSNMAAWALIFSCLFLELWDNCWSMSSFSTATDVELTTIVYLPLLLDISTNQPQNWVKLLN